MAFKQWKYTLNSFRNIIVVGESKLSLIDIMCKVKQKDHPGASHVGNIYYIYKIYLLQERKTKTTLYIHSQKLTNYCILQKGSF